MTKVYPYYSVSADYVTGEWLDEPKYLGTIKEDEYLLLKDTEYEHYDLYQVPVYDKFGTAMVETETRAIKVSFVK